jgi:hypothetical protein
VDTTHGHCPSCSRSVGLSDDRCIMGRHQCLRIPSNPSHSGSAEHGDDGQGSPMSASLPQLPFFLQASRLETIGCILRAKEFSEDAISCLTLAERRGTIDSYQS